MMQLGSFEDFESKKLALQTVRNYPNSVRKLAEQCPDLADVIFFSLMADFFKTTTLTLTRPTGKHGKIITLKFTNLIIYLNDI